MSLEKFLAAVAIGTALTLGSASPARAYRNDNSKICENVVIPANGLLQGVIAGIGGVQNEKSF